MLLASFFSAWRWDIMGRFARFTSRLLIWLTVLAMPLQPSPGGECACGQGGRESAAERHGCSSCADRSTCSKRPSAACERDGTSSTCRCGMVPGRSGGCQCGPGCRCAQSRNEPVSPAVPAPDNQRHETQSKVLFAATLSPVGSCVCVTPTTLTVEHESVCYLSGSQVCLRLCRLIF